MWPPSPRPRPAIPWQVAQASAKDIGVSKNLRYLPPAGTQPSSAETQRTAHSHVPFAPRADAEK